MGVRAWVHDWQRLRSSCVPVDPTAENPEPVRIHDLRRGLRLGRFASLDTLSCRGPDIAPGEWEWLALRRTTAPVPETRPPLADVLAGLSRARSPVLLLVQGGGGGVHLALPRGAPELAGWTRSVLAPASLLEPIRRPPDLRVFGNGDVNGLRFALLAAHEGGAASKRDGTALPGLGRLLLTPGDGWSLLVRLDPVSLPDAMDLRAELVALSSALAPHRSHTDSRDPRHSVTVEEPDVARLLSHIDTLLVHLEGAESVGTWLATTHVGAYGGAEVDMLTSVAGSVLEEDPFSGGRWSGDRLVVAADDDLPSPTSLLSTLDVAALLAAPRESVPGLEVAVQPPGGRTRQQHRQRMALGTWSGVSDPFSIAVEDLEGHGFITGTTGSGKSTTAQRLLAELWNEHRIPFLVIDPVKADYEAVSPSLKGGLAVVDAAKLRLNVLSPYGDFDRRNHLELVSNAFKGSFSLPSPVPYIVSQLFELLERRAEVEPAPTLHELRDLLDPFVTGLGYDSEISSNIRASLGTRLSLLLSPGKAERLAAPVSLEVEELFTRPTVVQLAGLGDDEERAFLMSVLTLTVLERARSLGPAPGVRHVTVLEEAHRILPEPSSGGGDPESGDAASVSARLLTQMLAEIRSYGEAILVVDQSPSAVARDVVKNTNLKIAHKVLDPSDREVIGGSMGLGEERRESIAGLARGQAVVLTRRLPAPQTVTVAKATNRRDSEGVLNPTAPSGADPRPCCAGADPVRHHAAERRSREAEGVMALALAGLIVDSAGEEALWEEVEHGLKAIALQDPLLAPVPDDAQWCLAWVGLRRGLLQMTEFGQIPRSELAKHLRAAFGAWQYRRRDPLFVRVRRRTAAARPFYGCRYCHTACLFRHQASASATHGVAAAEEALRSTWDGPAQPALIVLREWQLDTAAQLSDWLGDDSCARGSAMCTVTQVLHRRGAPTGVQDRLLLR